MSIFDSINSVVLLFLVIGLVCSFFLIKFENFILFNSRFLYFILIIISVIFLAFNFYDENIKPTLSEHINHVENNKKLTDNSKMTSAELKSLIPMWSGNHDQIILSVADSEYASDLLIKKTYEFEKQNQNTMTEQEKRDIHDVRAYVSNEMLNYRYQYDPVISQLNEFMDYNYTKLNNTEKLNIYQQKNNRFKVLLEKNK